MQHQLTFATLPLDVVNEIVDFLDILSLGRVRRVSSWFCAIADTKQPIKDRLNVFQLQDVLPETIESPAGQTPLTKTDVVKKIRSLAVTSADEILFVFSGYYNSRSVLYKIPLDRSAACIVAIADPEQDNQKKVRILKKLQPQFVDVTDGKVYLVYYAQKLQEFSLSQPNDKLLVCNADPYYFETLNARGGKPSFNAHGFCVGLSPNTFFYTSGEILHTLPRNPNPVFEKEHCNSYLDTVRCHGGDIYVLRYSIRSEYHDGFRYHRDAMKMNVNLSEIVRIRGDKNDVVYTTTELIEAFALDKRGDLWVPKNKGVVKVYLSRGSNDNLHLKTNVPYLQYTKCMYYQNDAMYFVISMASKNNRGPIMHGIFRMSTKTDE